MFRIYKWKNCSCKQVHRYFTQNNVQTKPTHRHYVKLTVATIAVTSPILYYYTLDSIGKRKWKVTIGGIYRFVRSLKIGLSISFDYKWTLYGLDELASEYEDAIKQVHARSAEKILKGCLANGGLYVKLGQGLASFNHILPPEYTETLKVIHLCFMLI